MKLPIAYGVLAAAGLGANLLGSSIPASSPLVIIEGRSIPEPDGTVRLGFPGVTAHLRFYGASLSMKAKASAETLVDAIVDGGEPTRIKLVNGEATYQVWASAKAAEHTVELVRCNESWQGTYAFVSFDAGEGGRFLEPAPLPPRRLMFIGDSVTCGAMAAWVPGEDMKEAGASNARLTFGMAVARHFGAQCHLVSYGGRGIIRDWQGIRDTRNAPQFYELAMPDDPTVFWNHATYVPDAIGIQLGTNDFNQGVPDQNEFVNAYVEFVRKVRRDAPNALIVIMDSPIVDDSVEKGPRRAVLHGYLAMIVERTRDPKVILAPLAHYPGVPGNGHPSGADHQAMALELEPVFKAALGW